MISAIDIALALPSESAPIATLSRDAIEYGLQWSWTPARVRRAIANRAINVVVAREAGKIVGFALAQYGDEQAHLLLMAVAANRRRRGIATALIAWLEQTFAVSGIQSLRAEVREANKDARNFYRGHGFRETGLRPGYYQGVEAAIELTKSFAAPKVS